MTCHFTLILFLDHNTLLYLLCSVQKALIVVVDLDCVSTVVVDNSMVLNSALKGPLPVTKIEVWTVSHLKEVIFSAIDRKGQSNAFKRSNNRILMLNMNSLKRLSHPMRHKNPPVPNRPLS